MVIARGGPGLWVVAAGALLAFMTLFLPPSPQTAFRRQDRNGGVLAWAADRESAAGRRALQIALGGAWLLDAALQYQPYMFSKSFVSQVLSPSAMGSPALLANPVMLSSQLIGHDTAALTPRSPPFSCCSAWDCCGGAASRQRWLAPSCGRWLFGG
jgi:hypothetical protein